MLPSKWTTNLAIGLPLFVYGSLCMHLAFDNLRWNSTLIGVGANVAIGFPMMAWGTVFAVRALRQIMSTYHIDRRIVIGAAFESASVVMTSLAVANYLQYLQLRTDLEECNSQIVAFCGRFMPMIYYNDFVTYSITGGVLGIIGAVLLIAGWRGKSKHPIEIENNDNR